MEKRKIQSIGIIVLTIILIAVTIGLYLGLPIQKKYDNINIMGNSTLQTFIKTNVLNQKKVGDRIYNEVVKVNNLVNPKVETSDVYKINNSKPNEKVSVDPITIELLEKSKSVFDKTGGLYNPAVFTLVDTWNFSAERFNPNAENLAVPTAEEIELGKKLAETFNNIEFLTQNKAQTANATFVVDKVNNTVTRTNKCFINGNSAKIDLGGIAKGYATDLCNNVFVSSPAKSGLVNLGGNIYSYGRDWAVGIENPFMNGIFSEKGEKENGILGVVTAKDISISCSGVYLRNYKIGDKLYHHIIDPTTGYPSKLEDDSIIMAAVIGKNGAICDAVATSLVLINKVNLAEQFINNNFKEEVNSVILITKNKQYKVIGDIPFAFNETELKGFTKI